MEMAKETIESHGFLKLRACIARSSGKLTRIKGNRFIFQVWDWYNGALKRIGLCYAN